MAMNINNTNELDAGNIYTDFQGLARLRAKASDNSPEANKAVAKQFEGLYLQMMLKSMREASEMEGSGESDQTRFYQEMFDKQIALDLSDKGVIGIAAAIEKQLGVETSLDEAQTEADLETAQVKLNEDGFWAIHHQLSQIVAKETLSVESQSKDSTVVLAQNDNVFASVGK